MIFPISKVLDPVSSTHLVMESDGTGAAAKVDGYSMGGKTGTAQKYPREDKKYLV